MRFVINNRLLQMHIIRVFTIGAKDCSSIKPYHIVAWPTKRFVSDAKFERDMVALANKIVNAMKTLNGCLRSVADADEEIAYKSG